jgi:maltose O-acetyltransferase
MGKNKINYAIYLFRVIYQKLFHNRNLKLNGYRYKFGRHLKLKLLNDGKLLLKSNVEFSDFCYIECSQGNISIGKNCFFNRGCSLVAFNRINIGNYCIFGPNVSIYDHNHRYTDNTYIRKQGYEIREVEIGNDVWIGANTVITAGAKIGEHVVIGANSVVTKDIPSNSLAAGSPAKVIRSI